MKSIQLRDSFGIDSLALADVPWPKPGPGEILIKVNAASLNYRDLLVVDGVFFPNLEFPFVPVSDAAGQVEQVGFGVTQFKPGDRVTTHFIQDWEDGPFSHALLSSGYLASSLGGPRPGILSEYVVLPERGVVPTPSYLSDEEAATLPIAALTAWESFRLGSLKAGQTLLVQGTGGVSIFALQIAKALGARVIITSSSDDKLRRATKLGADFTVNYKTNPDWWQSAKAATDGLGVDHVVDVGGQDTLNQAIKALKPGGFISVIGILTGVECKFDVLTFLRGNMRLQSLSVGSRQSFAEMNRFLEEHQLHPVVDAVFPWSESQEAFRDLKAGKHFGKLVLRPS
ncbi:MAG: NAD(P)-dependent alcohol dehydrogenase [Verrucomicrobia bacterium]|nr:NAD(P)-dependent alcohol dehydrogenase [Verrucomicrobiota bacterium]MBV8277342.1 NAD(P)-dependent alcohol dehydrogenase [Verrucomicrobiota bacterium]